MKTLTDKINEACEWYPKTLSIHKIHEYLDIIHKWVATEYSELNTETYFKMIKDNYKDYLKADKNSKLSDEKINKLYDSECDHASRVLKEMGIAQYDYFCLPQGFIDYMYYKINNK